MSTNSLVHYDINWLLNLIEQGKPVKYLFFWGHSSTSTEAVGKYCFSQWYPSPFTVEGVPYATAEHWMMAQKALLFDDKEAFEKIVASSKPAAAKQFGREIRNFDEERWLANRVAIVKEGNIHKFSQHKVLGDFLKGTASHILVEASPVDPIWGIGMAADNATVNNATTWKGLNLLGFILMEVRDVLTFCS